MGSIFGSLKGLQLLKTSINSRKCSEEQLFGLLEPFELPHPKALRPLQVSSPSHYTFTN